MKKMSYNISIKEMRGIRPAQENYERSKNTTSRAFNRNQKQNH